MSRAASGSKAVRWSTPIIHFGRTATKDTEIRGKKIREGDALALLLYGFGMAATLAWAAHRSRTGRARSLVYGLGWAALVVAV